MSNPTQVNGRTESEVRETRALFRLMSDRLNEASDVVFQADARIAWLFSVLPLSTPEEIGDALCFARDAFERLHVPGVLNHIGPDVAFAVRTSVREVILSLASLIDAMRHEAEENEETDRRRSVSRDELSQGSRWDLVPIEEVELLFETASALTDDLARVWQLGCDRADRLAAVVHRIREHMSRATLSVS